MGTAAVALLAWSAVAVGTAGSPARAQAGDGRAVASVADEAPGYAVEDFGYPGADKILADRNIVLKRGDGHILLADCAGGTGLLEVWSRSNAKICFRVTGTSGWLTLEIPRVYGIKGSVDQSAQVDMTTGTEAKTYDIAKNAFTGVGESTDPQGRDFVLMEIRTTA
ncbi:hypothetical protein GCM10009665_77680 [Kitasatospora nipponensis]|uniref:Secreted protein n=1 Tax=Kitasatospora nipponensis TaxID=258049 RepID=A0ABN1T9M6_9ACTN